MGSCPYCQATTLTGDTICYSCGRVLANARSPTFRSEQSFNRGSLSSSYMMATKPSRQGIVRTSTGREKNILKRRKNRFRTGVMLCLMAFILLSPQAREHMLAEWAGIQDYIDGAVAPYHMYPVEAEYTLSKTVNVDNTANSEGFYEENLAIPPTIYSVYEGQTTFEFIDGRPAEEAQILQSTTGISITIEGQTYNIPHDGLPSKSYADRITTTGGHEIWWPGVGPSDEDCSVTNCVKVKLNVDARQSSSYTYSTSVKSTSYSWHNSDRVDSRVIGTDSGVSYDRSGVFSDLATRSNGDRLSDFGDLQWYQRGGFDGYAINAQEQIIQETVALIDAMIPEGQGSNAYAFARAAFDYLHANVAYDRFAPVVARSGPECLEAGTGDCDEQTNAFLSLLRVKGIPGWYAFGALTDQTFSVWEAHAWGYIQLPMSSEWCAANSISESTCFVDAAVDVVNNKWLLHTPTGLIEWIEEADPSGDKLNSYYRPILMTQGMERDKTYDTTSGPIVTGGNYQVKLYPEKMS